MYQSRWRYRNVGILGCWNIEVWNIGILRYLNIGIYKDLLRYPLGREGVYAQVGLPS